jgi:hypothetical protein
MPVLFLPRQLAGDEGQDRLAIGFEARLADIPPWDGRPWGRRQPLDGPDHEHRRLLLLVNQVCHHVGALPDPLGIKLSSHNYQSYFRG